MTSYGVCKTSKNDFLKIIVLGSTTQN